MYLCIKYTFTGGRVMVIQGDQKIARKCYAINLKLRRICTQGSKSKKIGSRIKPPKDFHKGEKTSSITSEETEG